MMFSTQVLRTGIFCSVLGLAAGCGNKAEEPTEEPKVVIQDQSAANPMVPVEEVIDKEALPIPSDFEEEMASTITEENYEKELDSVEKDLDSDT